MTKQINATLPEYFSKKNLLLHLEPRVTPPIEMSAVHPVLSRTAERIVHNHLYSLIKINGWLCSDQAGFGKLR